jgi:hypothetical protein
MCKGDPCAETMLSTAISPLFSISQILKANEISLAALLLVRLPGISSSIMKIWTFQIKNNQHINLATLPNISYISLVTLSLFGPFTDLIQGLLTNQYPSVFLPSKSFFSTMKAPRIFTEFKPHGCNFKPMASFI